MATIPSELIMKEVDRVHNGLCPECQGPGPVEAFQTHRINSFVYLTRTSSTIHVCCSACARRKALDAIIACALTGWWGFPWGLIKTPVQIAHNIRTRNRKVVAGEPSQELINEVMMMIAAEGVQPSPELLRGAAIR